MDDVVEAFLLAGASDACNGDVFNVGGDRAVSLRDLAELLVDVAGAGTVRYIPWPDDRRPIDIGNFHTDSSKFKRTVGWTGAVDLCDGLTRTVRFYRDHLTHYVEAPSGAHPRTPHDGGAGDWGRHDDQRMGLPCRV